MITVTIEFAGERWDVRHDGAFVDSITLHDSTFDLMPYLSSGTLRRLSAKFPKGVAIICMARKVGEM